MDPRSFLPYSPDVPRVPDRWFDDKRMNSSSSDPPPSPRRTKRQKSVTPSQLIAESQSLLSPVAHDASTGTPLSSAVEVNVESQLTHGTEFPSDSSVSSVSVTAADGATLLAAAADSATIYVTANSTMAAVFDPFNYSNDVVALPTDGIVPPTSLEEVIRSPAILLDREDWFKLL